MTIAIIGGDKRYVYLYELLCQKGYDVLTFGLLDGQDSNITLEDTITSADFIILPIPFKAPADLYEYISSRQTIISGYIPPDIRNFFKERGISNYDFSKSIDIKDKSEFGMTAEALNKAQDNIRNLIKNIRDNALKLTESSENFQH